MDRLVWKYADRWAASGVGGVTAADLHQEGFIAMLQAVEHFSVSRGTRFSTVLHVYLQKAFSIATGQRTKRDRLDPIQSAFSLDVPLDDSEGATPVDFIPAPAAEDGIREIEEQDWLDRLRADLDFAIASLSDAEQRTIRAHYYQGKTLEQIAAAEGISRQGVAKREQNALRHLAQSKQLTAYL